MAIPKLSHLQFLVLSTLLREPKRGQEIRKQLAQFGVRKSGPGFYQLMARLEDAGFVSGRYRQEVIDGQIVREREYRIRAAGTTAWTQSRDFQDTIISELGLSRNLIGG